MMSLKGFAWYSEISTIVHLIIFALIGLLGARLSRRFIKPKETAGTVFEFRILELQGDFEFSLSFLQGYGNHGWHIVGVYENRVYLQRMPK